MVGTAKHGEVNISKLPSPFKHEVMIEVLSHVLCTLLLYQIFAACWLLVQYVLESLLCVHENSLMMAASCWDTSVEPAVATLNLFVCQFVILPAPTTQ